MSALVNYRKTGRIAFAAWAWYNFADSVSDKSMTGTTFWGYAAAEATIGIFIPEPVFTAAGFVITRTASGLKNAWWRLGSAYWAMPIAQRSLATYLVVLPFAIASRQSQKMEAGDVGLDEALGQAMWKAQSIPDTERLNVPSIVGGRGF